MHPEPLEPRLRAIASRAAAPTPRRGAIAALAAAAALGACAVAPRDATHSPARAPTPRGVGAQSPGPGASAPLLPAGRQAPTRVGRMAVRDTGPAGADGEVIAL